MGWISIKGVTVDILEIYQKSVWVITYLKKHPRGGSSGHGVTLNEITRALNIKRADIYPVIDYLIQEGFIERPNESNDNLFRLTYKALIF
jgi:DNA-binding MarR family transcriptional regulator